MKASRYYPRLPLPCWKVPHKSGEILDTDNPLAWEIAEPIFKAGINQVAILNRKDFVRTMPCVRPDSHLFALQIQGETGVSINDTTTWLSVGDLAFIPAGTSFVHTGKQKLTFSYIYITIADDERWNGLKKRGPWIRAYESADYLYLLVRRLLDAHVTRSVVTIEHANRDSYTLVDLLMRETLVSTKQDTQISLALKGLISQIRAKPDAKWNNAEMASLINLSERTFLRVFKQEFNTSPKSMVMKQRMSMARERLEFTDAAIKTIAQELGYANRRTFTTLFMSYVGMSPEEFRQRSAGRIK